MKVDSKNKWLAIITNIFGTLSKAHYLCVGPRFFFGKGNVLIDKRESSLQLFLSTTPSICTVCFFDFNLKFSDIIMHRDKMI